MSTKRIPKAWNPDLGLVKRAIHPAKGVKNDVPNPRNPRDPCHPRVWYPRIARKRRITRIGADFFHDV